MAQAFYPLPNNRAGNPCGGSLHELAAPKMHSRHVTIPLVSSYLTFSPFHPQAMTMTTRRGQRQGLGCCCFLLHDSAFADCFYIRKWDALCCPDFPLQPSEDGLQRQTAWLLSNSKGRYFFPHERLNSTTRLHFFHLFNKKACFFHSKKLGYCIVEQCSEPCCNIRTLQSMGTISWLGKACFNCRIAVASFCSCAYVGKSTASLMMRKFA